MKKILALTDFSENAYHAIKYAQLLAGKWDAESITLLNTYEMAPVLLQGDGSNVIGPDVSSNYMDYNFVMEQAAIIKKDSLAKMEKLAEELATAMAASIAIHTKVEEGNLISATNEICEQENIDIVVMGFHSKEGLDKVLMGSKAIEGLKSIKFPLLIIPYQAALEAPHTIALASDLTSLSNEAEHQIKSFAGKDHNKFMVINIITKPEIDTKDPSTLEVQLESLLPEFHFLQSKHIGAGIEDFLRDERASLLIITRQEHGLLSQLFHKNVGKELAWQTAIPLLRIWNNH